MYKNIQIHKGINVNCIYYERDGSSFTMPVKLGVTVNNVLDIISGDSFRNSKHYHIFDANKIEK